MSDLHSLVTRIAKRCGVITGGIHAGFSAQANRWDATIFKGQHVVHTARHTRASVSDCSDNKVAPFGQFVDDGRLRKARIDEFSMVHGLCHAIFGTQSLGDMGQQDAGVLFAVVEEPSHLTAYICEPWGERAPFEHLLVGGVQETKAADAFKNIIHEFPFLISLAPCVSPSVPPSPADTPNDDRRRQQPGWQYPPADGRWERALFRCRDRSSAAISYAGFPDHTCRRS